MVLGPWLKCCACKSTGVSKPQNHITTLVHPACMPTLKNRSTWVISKLVVCICNWMNRQGAMQCLDPYRSTHSISSAFVRVIMPMTIHWKVLWHCRTPAASTSPYAADDDRFVSSVQAVAKCQFSSGFCVRFFACFGWVLKALALKPGLRTIGRK